MNSLKDFYKNKNVLVTGHTGFKGSVMCQVLLHLGANVTGYALDAPTNPALFDLCSLSKKVNSINGDIRDLEHLLEVFEKTKPEIVIHMAAQPIVRTSYEMPVYTYETNVMGTVNVLEAIRMTSSVKSFVNVTTDKVYLNVEDEHGYREDEYLNGYDPYSNSKSCSELVTSSYKNSFFGGKTGKMADGRVVAISTARAGNVIGGGDFALDRIIPDCIRAMENNSPIIVRNPNSTRPYQHVLEPVVAYLMIAMRQYENISLAGCYNIGPRDEDCWTTGRLVDLFCKLWNEEIDKKVKENEEAIRLSKAGWINQNDNGPHEANFLKLDCSLVRKTFDWEPVWSVNDAMQKIVEWSVAYLLGEDVNAVLMKQVVEYLKRCGE